MIFDNTLVKKFCSIYNFKNPFDVTKINTSSQLPEILLDNDTFIIHLGKGRHMFVKGVDTGYHKFEDIDEQEIFDWPYHRSILNEYDTSESNILSVVTNQKIIHDFLYQDIIANPMVYGSRRTKKDLIYYINNEKIEALSVQMEIDLTMELGGDVTVFEAKNIFVRDFAVYQIFHPFKYYIDMKNNNHLNIDKVTCCYIIREKKDEGSTLKLYNYTFEDEERMSTIKLLKNAQYNLTGRQKR